MRAWVGCLQGLAPGSAAFGALTVCGVAPKVSALATKTRPKRLALLGSDGRRHTYLLKGREDLRLDERLMQVGGWVVVECACVS